MHPLSLLRFLDPSLLQLPQPDEEWPWQASSIKQGGLSTSSSLLYLRIRCLFSLSSTLFQSDYLHLPSLLCWSLASHFSSFFSPSTRNTGGGFYALPPLLLLPTTTPSINQSWRLDFNKCHITSSRAASAEHKDRGEQRGQTECPLPPLTFIKQHQKDGKQRGEAWQCN